MDFIGLIAINDWVLLLGVLALAAYKYMSWHYDWWSSQGIRGPKPQPFGLHSLSALMEGLKFEKRCTRTYGDTVGFYEGRKPMLLTQDDDVLREVLVKQFHNFSNRRFFEFPGGFISKGIFSLREEDGWKETRDLLSPVFSSGKIKKMTTQVNECALHTIKNIGDLPATGKVFNLKTIFSEMSMKFIATVAFGLDLGDEENIREFSVMGRNISEQFNAVWRAIILFFMPKLGKFLQDYLGIQIMDLSGIRFFSKVVDSVLESRQKKGNAREDLIQAMANAHNETVDEETVEENKKMGEHTNMAKKAKCLEKSAILDNGVLFFIAGFDTVSSSMAFLFYELSLNPDIQERVYEEVSEILDKKDELNYADVQELKFLECCFCEALRLHPVVARIDRQANEDITVRGINIKKGMVVNIPISTIHHDPRRWPNPNKYRPERFTEEEKKNRSPFSWMPFGYGPRHCIGMRLALMEAKLAAAHIIYNFRFEPCSTTQIPFKPGPIGIVTGAGLDITILPRSIA